MNNLSVAPVFEIVRASWRDVTELHELEHDCFDQDAWSLLDLVGVLTLPATSRLKAVVAEKMVGFVAGDIRNRERTGWISTIGVLSTYRGYGIGRALLRASEQDMKMPTVCLCVRQTNTPAIQLYHSEGYRQVDLWEHYYPDGEAAIIMQKVLRKPAAR